MALVVPTHPPPSNSTPSAVKGIITRDVLLDERNHFLPYDLSRFTRVIYYQPTGGFFYWELEVIWQGVPSSSWIELESLMVTEAVAVKAREAQLSANRSYNFLSSEVWRNWMELHLVRSKVPQDFEEVMLHSGLYLHLLRDKFIADYNTRNPDLDPPLRRTDDLRIRLAPFGGLDSLAVHRKQFQRDRVADPARWFGPITKEEKRHLRAFGIYFDSEPEFDHVVDTRSFALSDLRRPTATISC